jgi:outer membrane protein, multidrug efflux system
MMRRAILAACLLAVVSACRLGPNYERPGLTSPEAYVQQAPAGASAANLPWWELFKDERLQNLVRTALQENKDLKIAVARIVEGRAALGFTKADQWPSIDWSASAGRLKSSDQVIQDFGGVRRDVYSLAADLNFEIDLWGKLRRSTEAAAADLLSTEEAARSVTITLVSDVASGYLSLRDLDAELEISKRTLESRRESLRLIRLRFEKGIIPELDVHQAEIEEATAAASVASFERAVTQTENALSVLLGRNPGPIDRGARLDEQVFPPDIPVGLPSELLERRPDVLSAEQALHAQTARIGVAQAARFPILNLTGSYGYASSELSNLNASGASVWSFGASLFGPLFNYGRNRRRVEIEKARTEQAVQAYESTVLQAFREAEDALVAVRTYGDEYEARRRQVEAARGAARLSRARYDNGVTSYLEVLDSERSLFSAELDASLTLRQRLVSIVQLYKALGGGWTPEPPPQASP